MYQTLQINRVIRYDELDQGFILRANEEVTRMLRHYIRFAEMPPKKDKGKPKGGALTVSLKGRDRNESILIDRAKDSATMVNEKQNNLKNLTQQMRKIGRAHV